MPKPVGPPSDENELLLRAAAIAGKTLQQVASQYRETVPADLTRDKGWTGTLLERVLGATASSLSEPDFQSIGVELKSIPINRYGKPKESTYICTVPLQAGELGDWLSSAVCRKLARVLWVPVEADPALPLAERRIGSARLWSPDPQQREILESDWEELTGMIATGELEQITVDHGRILQIRPKAAHGRSLRRGIDATGNASRTLPRGFYLRAGFTASILNL